MKTKILLIILYLATLASYVVAQSPGFNYQAVLRNTNGETLANAEVTLHFSLIDGPSNTVLYKETQTLTTNELGILTCMVGSGTVESGTFAEITGVQDLNIKIEAELPGESGITEIGESRIGVIPYALYGRDEDSDPGNEMQELSLEGDSLKISGALGVSLDPIKSPWEYNADSNAYFLGFPGTDGKRDNHEEGIEFRYLNGKVIQTTQLNGGIHALFLLRDEKMFEELPLTLRKAYNRMTLYIHEEFGVDFSPNDLNIDANFSAKDNKVLDFVMHVTLGNEGNSRIWIESNSFAGSLDLMYVDNEKTIKLNGVIAEDCSAFKLGFGSLDVLGVKKTFVGVNGERKLFSDNFVNQHYVDAEGNTTTPAHHVDKDDAAGSTKWSIFSSNEDNDCFHVTATPSGVENILFGNSGDVIAKLFANDKAGWALNGAGCSSQGDCKSIFLVNEDGKRSAPFASSLLSSNSDLSGVLQLSGSQSGNLQMTSLSGFPNNGYLLVLDKESQNKAGIFINDQDQGVVYGSNISAVVNEDAENPTIYGALVGDETAAYTRGTAKLINGEAKVICPDHFQNIADPNSMTVTITPLSGKSLGIAVVEKFPGGFKVRELAEGTGTYDFDYMVSCKRKGFEKVPVQRKMPTANNVKSKEVQALVKNASAN